MLCVCVCCVCSCCCIFVHYFYTSNKIDFYVNSDVVTSYIYHHKPRFSTILYVGGKFVSPEFISSLAGNPTQAVSPDLRHFASLAGAGFLFPIPTMSPHLFSLFKRKQQKRFMSGVKPHQRPSK